MSMRDSDIKTPFLKDFAMVEAGIDNKETCPRDHQHPFTVVREDVRSFESLQIEDLPLNNEQHCNNSNVEEHTKRVMPANLWSKNRVHERSIVILICLTFAVWVYGSGGGTPSAQVVNLFGEFYDLSTTRIDVTAVDKIDEFSSLIPSELGLLTELTYLKVFRHAKGPIPTQLGQLVALTELDLHHNLLTGEIPSELGLLTSLTKLNLSSNSMVGSIPSHLGQLENMKMLELHRNHFKGHLPTSICELPGLDIIEMDNEVGQWMCP